MAVEMKWYIFDKDEHPLCWAENNECPCCEFDTQEDAERFRSACLELPNNTDLGEMIIKNCIFFYDDGKRNMSGLIPIQNGDDLELKEWR